VSQKPIGKDPAIWRARHRLDKCLANMKSWELAHAKTCLEAALDDLIEIGYDPGDPRHFPKDGK